MPENLASKNSQNGQSPKSDVGVIFCVGGESLFYRLFFEQNLGPELRELKSVEVYDYHKNCWYHTCDLITKRWYPGVVSVDDKM